MKTTCGLEKRNFSDKKLDRAKIAGRKREKFGPKGSNEKKAKTPGGGGGPERAHLKRPPGTKPGITQKKPKSKIVGRGKCLQKVSRRNNYPMGPTLP